MASSPSSRARARIGLALALFVVLALGVGFAASTPAVRAALAELIARTRALGVLAPVAVAAFYVPACVSFLPGSVITLAAAFVLGFWPALFAVSIGSTLGAFVAFGLGRTLLRETVARSVRSRPRFAAIDRAVGKNGFWIVLLTRLSPVFPFNLLNYAYGLTSVRPGAYLFASWIGMLPGTAMYVSLGTTMKSVAEIGSGRFEGGLWQRALFVLGLLATIALTVWISRLARRELEVVLGEGEAAEARHDTIPERGSARGGLW